jgi:cytidine deaminase
MISTLNKELSYGINICHPTGVNGIHAEAYAIMNLPSLPRKKNLKKIDILVIRTSAKARLGMSKPCIKCLIDMSILPQKKGYVIKNIFYSDKDGNIVNTTLKHLINCNDYYVSRFYRERNFQIK